MFDNTITLARNGTNLVLTRLQEQDGTSLYRFRDSTQQVELSIRHSTERAQPNGVVFERHNYAVVRTVYPVAPSVIPAIESTNVTVRYQRGSDPVSSRHTALSALGFGTAANLDRVILGEN